jgi:hypothetical protein
MAGMNAPATATLSDTQRIETALDELLKAALASTIRFPHPLGGMYSAGQLLDYFGGMTRAQRDADALLSDPVGEAVRRAITTLGRRLHEIGGLALMQDICDRAAALDPANEGRRMDIIDKRWDGIGGWYA